MIQKIYRKKIKIHTELSSDTETIQSIGDISETEMNRYPTPDVTETLTTNN